MSGSKPDALPTWRRPCSGGNNSDLMFDCQEKILNFLTMYFNLSLITSVTFFDKTTAYFHLYICSHMAGAAGLEPTDVRIKT